MILLFFCGFNFHHYSISLLCFFQEAPENEQVNSDNQNNTVGEALYNPAAAHHHGLIQ